jgi:predicted Rossmann fold flavoprotein
MPDVIILGAGAAGLMCAIEAGKRGRSVLVLERNPEVAEKVRISGGGRCNFTNTVTDHDHYLSQNPHFCKSALARFSPDDFIALIEKHRIAYHEKTAGQLFCDGSSRQVIEMLKHECREAGVAIHVNSTIVRVHKGARFVVTTNRSEEESDSLVIATGGLSIPKMGATDLGYRLARQFGLNIIGTTPGLVPLTMDQQDTLLCRELSGVSLDAVVRCNGRAFRGNILFTHRGLSGPAILQISSYWTPGDPISLDLSPEADFRDILTNNHRTGLKVAAVLSTILPKRLARSLCERYGWLTSLNNFRIGELVSIGDRLHDWQLIPQGTEGYAKAEVTCGGVDTKELSSKTMEAKGVPGLYFIGEVVDVTGHLGGYNFQWAWASGFAAGKVA